MKFTKAFKRGFSMFGLEKMTHFKSIRPSKAMMNKLRVAENVYKAESRLSKIRKRHF